MQLIAGEQPELLFISLLVQVLAASDLLSSLELQCMVCTWLLLQHNSQGFEEFFIAKGLQNGDVAISRPSAHCVHAIAHIASSMDCLYSVFRLLSMGNLCTPPHAVFDGSIFSFLCQSLSLDIAGSQQILSHKDVSLAIIRHVAARPDAIVVSLWDDLISPIARLQKFDEEWSIWTEVSFSATSKVTKVAAHSARKFKLALFCQCEARYEDDGEYYAATVVGIKGGQYLVKFTDYQDSFQLTPPEHIRAPNDLANASQHRPLPAAATADPLAGLPISGHVQPIIDAVTGSSVVVIEGETGCGKSSGIPIILYNSYKGRVKILITQPRRLACKTLSQRVASMLGTVVGGIVGYRVHGASCVSHLTAIEFVTTGWLLMRLAARPSLSEYSHVILDEVHERSEDSELLCTIVKKLSEKATSQSGKFPKLLVMSATLDSGLFSRYFSTLQTIPVPVLHVGAQRFPVEMVYIEDLLRLCDETRDPHRGTVESFMKECLPKKSKTSSIKPDVRPGLFATVLVGIRALCRPGDSVLIFLPGSSEILEMIDWIERHSESPIALRQSHSDSSGSLRNFTLGRTHAVALHSMIPLEEQEESLQPPSADCIKIIVSTNLAESSVTIPHVKTVIDAGLQRSISYDPHREVVSLKRQWCSQASARQRCGRVGRVCPGTVLRLYTREHHDRFMNPFEASGLLNAPLESIVLRLRLMLSSMGTVSEILSSSLEPPKSENVSRAVQRLYELGALDGSSENSNVTVLGQLAASLPSLSISSSRLILAGIICGCECEAALAAGAMSAQDPFSLPNRLFTKHHALFLQQTKESMEMRTEFDNHQYSDVIARVSLICNWFASSFNFSHWCGESKVSPSRVSQMLSSMEDAVISCSRALRKIIDLHNVDALHISSKRFCDAANNLSALGDLMSSCRSLARKKAAAKTSSEKFASFFKAGPSSLRFAIAVSLSPNWIKGSFKSHADELVSECPRDTDVSQCLSFNVSGHLADPEIFRASFGPFKDACRVYRAVKQGKKPVIIMEFRHRPLIASGSSRVCSLSYIGPGGEMPIAGDGHWGNPCSKWFGCQPVLVDIPTDAKCIVSALSAHPRVVGIPAQLIRQVPGSPEYKPLNANEFGEVTEVVDIPRCVSKYKWKCMFSGGGPASMPERSPVYRATEIRSNPPREIFAVIPSFINLESSHTAHVECPTLMPTQGRLAQLIVLLSARGSVDCSVTEDTKQILDFEISGDKVTLFPFAFGAADLAIVNCARAVFTSVFSGSVLALPTVHASLWRHLQALFDRAAAAEPSASPPSGRTQSRQLLSTSSKEDDLGFGDVLQRVFEMFAVFPEWRHE
jgi:HrpA-like RNA helicase